MGKAHIDMRKHTGARTHARTQKLVSSASAQKLEEYLFDSSMALKQIGTKLKPVSREVLPLAVNFSMVQKLVFSDSVHRHRLISSFLGLWPLTYMRSARLSREKE